MKTGTTTYTNKNRKQLQMLKVGDVKFAKDTSESKITHWIVSDFYELVFIDKKEVKSIVYNGFILFFKSNWLSHIFNNQLFSIFSISLMLSFFMLLIGMRYAWQPLLLLCLFCYIVFTLDYAILSYNPTKPSLYHYRNLLLWAAWKYQQCYYENCKLFDSLVFFIVIELPNVFKNIQTSYLHLCRQYASFMTC